MKRIFFLGYISFLLFLPTIVQSSSPPSPNIVELLQKLVQFDTTNPPGNELQLTQFIKEYLASYQIDSEIIESSPGRGNLIARIKGTGTKEPLLLLGHLDVVTADPKEWQVPPFEGKIVGDYLYGRGAIDMKGMVALEIATLVELKLREFPLAGDVLLVLVADEENGGKYGAEFLVEKYWEKIKPRYVLNEGSIGLQFEDKHLYPIQVAEKGVAWLKLTAQGTSGHGAMPSKDNAVVRLVNALQRLTTEKQPIQKTAIVKEVLNRLSTHFSFPKSFLMKHFFDWPIRNLVSAFASSNVESDKIFNAMVRNTVVPTVLQAGSKTNVIPATATALVDCRILPGETPQGFQQKITNSLHDPEINIELIQQNLPTESDFHTPFFEALTNAILANDPQAIVVPYISPGGTDNRFFRAKNIVSYGLIPMLISKQDLEGLHGKDERVPLIELTRGKKILYDLVTKLQGPVASPSR